MMPQPEGTSRPTGSSVPKTLGVPGLLSPQMPMGYSMLWTAVYLTTLLPSYAYHAAGGLAH